jgi:hypothetical protein
MTGGRRPRALARNRIPPRHNRQPRRSVAAEATSQPTDRPVTATFGTRGPALYCW